MKTGIAPLEPPSEEDLCRFEIIVAVTVRDVFEPFHAGKQQVRTGLNDRVMSFINRRIARRVFEMGGTGFMATLKTSGFSGLVDVLWAAAVTETDASDYLKLTSVDSQRIKRNAIVQLKSMVREGKAGRFLSVPPN